MDPLRSTLSTPDGADGAEEVEPRRDQRLRDIVDDGIALMRVAGTLPALEYLKSHAVEGRIIARVLLEPGKRRAARRLAPA